MDLIRLAGKAYQRSPSLKPGVRESLLSCLTHGAAGNILEIDTATSGNTESSPALFQCHQTVNTIVANQHQGPSVQTENCAPVWSPVLLIK